MNKKSQGLSINTIILAALALIVLVVMVLIFTGQIQVFSKSVSCDARGGKCSDLRNGESIKCPDDLPIQIYTQDCKLVKDTAGDGKITEIGTKGPGQCCVPIGS
tara:strand:- start:4013 stop:4324 length:312 start_codon:yes stop_codon:yes gene_type:complete